MKKEEEVVIEPKPKISLEDAQKAAQEANASKRKPAVSRDEPKRDQPQQDFIKNLVDHLVNVHDLNKLLQISPIPRNAIVDFVYDACQRAFMDEERIKLRIPLQEIAAEVYLRALRGADQNLSMALYRMGDTIVSGESSKEEFTQFER